MAKAPFDTGSGVSELTEYMGSLRASLGDAYPKAVELVDRLINCAIQLERAQNKSRSATAYVEIEEVVRLAPEISNTRKRENEFSHEALSSYDTKAFSEQIDSILDRIEVSIKDEDTAMETLLHRLRENVNK